MCGLGLAFCRRESAVRTAVQIITKGLFLGGRGEGGVLTDAHLSGPSVRLAVTKQARRPLGVGGGGVFNGIDRKTRAEIMRGDLAAAALLD